MRRLSKSYKIQLRKKLRKICYNILMHPKLWLIVAPAILVALAVSYTFSAQLTFWWLGLSVFLLILLSLQAVFVSNRKTAALFLALESMALASFLVIASPEGA